MKKCISLVLVILFVFSCSGKQGIPFSKLNQPVLIKLSDDRDTGGFKNVVFDWEKNAIFSTYIIEDFEQVNQFFPVFSLFSGGYYYFSQAKSEVLCIDPVSGLEAGRYPLPKNPLSIQSFITRQGYLVFRHANLEEQGIRVSLFDTKNNKVYREDLFVEHRQNGPFYYDGGDVLIYYTLNETDRVEIRSLNFVTGEKSLIHTLDAGQFPGEALFENNNLWVLVNSGHNENNNGGYLNRPEVLVFETGDYTLFRDLAFPASDAAGILWNILVHNSNVYVIYGDPREPGTIMKRWFYRFEAETTTFQKIDSDCLFDMLYYNPLHIRDNLLIGVFTDGAEFEVSQVDMGDFQN